MASVSTQTQNQLSQLTLSIGELTTAVKVHEEHLQEVERRVGIIETEETKRRDRGESTVVQRQQSLVLMGIQSVVSLIFLLISVLLAHAWK
jgi:hypothetical protein